MEQRVDHQHSMDPAEYFASRPAVFVAAGVLMRNAAGDVLVVKPTYAPRWVIPGGAMDPGESPRQTAQRETLEELGIDRDPGALLCVDFVPPRPHRPMPGIVYLFDGGELSGAEQTVIRLPNDELSAHVFVPVSDLHEYMSGLILRRVRVGLEALGVGLACDLVDGYRPNAGVAVAPLGA